jgi:hypothetical protein
MRKGFMMIEIGLIILGLGLLISVSLNILQYACEDFSYNFVEVSKKCNLICSIKKLTL